MTPTVSGAGAFKVLASAAAMMAGLDSGSSWESLVTDQVRISEVFDPKVGSGILAVYARITGSTGDAKARDYAVLYMGLGQTLPTVDTTCDITYRHGRISGVTDRVPIEWRVVEEFACSDGKHFPDGSPRYMLP